jgi:hypothetical protein
VGAVPVAVVGSAAVHEVLGVDEVQPAGEVRVRALHAAVDDAHRDACAARDRPGLLGVDVRVDPSSAQAIVEQRPLVGEPGVVGQGVHGAVGCRPQDIWIGTQFGQRVLTAALGDVDQFRVGEAHRPLELGVAVLADVGSLRGIHARLDPDDDLLGHRGVVGARRRGGEGEREQRECDGAGEGHCDCRRQPSACRERDPLILATGMTSERAGPHRAPG